MKFQSQECTQLGKWCRYYPNRESNKFQIAVFRKENIFQFIEFLGNRKQQRLMTNSIQLGIDTAFL